MKNLSIEEELARIKSNMNKPHGSPKHRALKKMSAAGRHNEVIHRMELKEKPRARVSTFKPRKYY
jgi:hypothetical protein